MRDVVLCEVFGIDYCVVGGDVRCVFDLGVGGCEWEECSECEDSE